MFDLQNKLEYPKEIKPTTPRCRRSIKEAVKYKNNNNTMSLNSDLSTTRRKVGLSSKECNDTSNSDFDCNSTDSTESSSDNTYEKNCSSKYISSSKDYSYDESSKRKENSKLLSFFPYVLIVALVTYVLIFNNVSQNNDNDELRQDLYAYRKETIQNFRKSVKNIQSKFKNQNLDVWHAFASQVEEIINESAKTSVVILLGNETNTVTCLAHSFGHISSKALNNNNYLTLNARNIGNEHGEIINKLKAEIQINRVVIIEDLLTINSEAIKVLHNLCDKEKPLVSKTLYILTMISNDYKGNHKDKFVEDNLTAKFSKVISLDILNPLITRIMDGPIVLILPEPSFKRSKTIEECLLF